MSCGELIQIRVSSGVDEDYDSLVVKAMHRLSSFLPGAAIHRHESDCSGNGEEWYLDCGHSELSAGGNSLSGLFTFARSRE